MIATSYQLFGDQPSSGFVVEYKSLNNLSTEDICSRLCQPPLWLHGEGGVEQRNSDAGLSSDPFQLA